MAANTSKDDLKIKVVRMYLTSITPFVGDVRASEIVSLARAKLRRGTSNNLCTAPY